MQLLEIYERLSKYYGPRDWWPADTAFEVMVGAILTQNTAWTNVVKAIDNLKAADCLNAESINSLSQDRLAQLIRPSGYYNVKAKRLQAYCRWYLERGGFDALDAMPTDAMREAILSVYGVGPETAEDIVLYAFNRPVFVIDTYTRRTFSRLGLVDGTETHEELRQYFQDSLPAESALFNEYHALIVIHAKDCCRKKPLCGQCPLAMDCDYFKGREEC